MDVYSTQYDKFVLLGDFNAKEGEPELSEFLHTNELKIYNNKTLVLKV